MPLKQEVTYHRSYKGEPIQTTISNLQHPNFEAQLALQLLERWGLVAGMDDGEDSAGRAKLKLVSAEEAVERAFDISHRACAVIEERGLFVTVASEEEREQIMQERENRRENGKK